MILEMPLCEGNLETFIQNPGSLISSSKLSARMMAKFQRLDLIQPRGEVSVPRIPPNKRTVTVNEVVLVMAHVTAGLLWLHDLGLTHGNIHPRNSISPKMNDE